MASIMIYGFTRDDLGFRATEKYTLYAHDVSISAMHYICGKFREENPEVVEVIAADNRVGLRQEWLKSINTSSRELRYEFYDTIKRAGITLYEAPVNAIAE